jgi:5-(carboxyamino)imidazole ribonucleotide mutase
MTAAMTSLPVVGVPVPRENLDGLDSLLSIVQMPPGIPVATVGIGEGRNAGLLAVRILAATSPELRRLVESFQAKLADAVREKDESVRKQFE